MKTLIAAVLVALSCSTQVQALPSFCENHAEGAQALYKHRMEGDTKEKWALILERFLNAENVGGEISRFSFKYVFDFATSEKDAYMTVLSKCHELAR